MSVFDLLTEEQQKERYSCCIRKIKHATEEDAKRSKGRIEVRGSNRPLRVYQCPYCGFWHVGGYEEDPKEVKIVYFEGKPYRKLSIQHSPEDAKSFRDRLMRKGYSVKIKRKQNSSKTRRNYHVYAYHPVRDAKVTV
jgi:hypothetical protein